MFLRGHAAVWNPLKTALRPWLNSDAVWYTVIWLGALWALRSIT
jgi:hypothetical protein